MDAEVVGHNMVDAVAVVVAFHLEAPSEEVFLEASFAGLEEGRLDGLLGHFLGRGDRNLEHLVDSEKSASWHCLGAGRAGLGRQHHHIRDKKVGDLGEHRDQVEASAVNRTSDWLWTGNPVS